MDEFKALRENYKQVVDGALACLSLRLQHPCLILIYTLIDSLAWACSDNKSGGVKKRFEQWVSIWLNDSIQCTATEIYAARCAVLHTLTSKAELTKCENVREIAYAWGTCKAADLQEAIDRTGNQNLVAIHIDQLLVEVCNAMDRILYEAERDPSLKQNLQDAAKQHLVYDTRELVEQYLAQRRDA
jgi:hypothetical protein